MAAAYAGRLLAQYGADVVKIEPPGGDPTRHYDLVGDGSPEPELSALFHHLSGGKRSVVAEVESAEGREVLARLVAGADILVEDLGPAKLEQLGLGWERLRAEHPSLWVLSISPFGSWGPYAGYRTTPLVGYAAGGFMYQTGEPDRPGVIYGFQAENQAGLSGFAAAALALLQSQRGRPGQRIEIAAMEVAASQAEEVASHAFAHEHLSRFRLGNKLNSLWAFYPASDGWIGVVGLQPNYPQIAEALEIPEIMDTDRYARKDGVIQNSDELEARIIAWTSDRTRAEVFSRGVETRAPFATVLTPGEVMDWEPLKAAGFWRALEHPVAGKLTVPGPALTLGAGDPPARRAPLLGEHTREAVEDWCARETRPSNPAPDRPLAGVRVLDTTIIWAGPQATAMLADMGAEVIKVEGPGAIEPTRYIGLITAAEERCLISPFVAHYCRNKLGIAVDVKRAEGRQLLLELAATADVIVDNFRPGVMERLGLTYDDLRAVNPRIVAVQMPGFASKGPESAWAAYGPVVEAMSGLCGLGGVEGEPPLFSGISYSDPVAANLAAGAVIMGLIHRDRTGEGQRIELSQRNNIINLIGEAYVEHTLTGRTPRRLGVRHPTWAPQGVYPCRPLDPSEGHRLLETDEVYTQRWLALSVTSDAEWRALCGVMAATGGPNLDGDASFATAAQRRLAHDEIDRVLAAWTAERDVDELFHALQRAGVPASPAFDSVDHVRDPHLVARRFLEEAPQSCLGTARFHTPVWRLSETPQHVRSGAPVVGEHNEQVLRELLGKTEDEIAALRRAGIVWKPEDAPLP